MPNRDGQGPGSGSGRMDGQGGECFCPNCSCRVSHERGQPCYEKKCPQCGDRMVRA